jgi:multidrug efflux system membrane fusion protein
MQNKTSQPMPEIEAPEHPQNLLAPPPDEPTKVVHVERAAPRRRRWPYVVILAILVLAGLYWWHGHGKPASTAKAGAKGGKTGAPAATPVVAVLAQTGNIGVYVTGLGAITPIYTVTVKSRVDGQLMSVHFKEGDLVNQGDPLIEIDPRPYEAAVVQAQGALVRDTALLANSRVDLSRYQTLLAQDAIP